MDNHNGQLKVFIAARPQILDPTLLLLEDSPRFRVAGTATNGEECLLRFGERKVDIALLDFALPKISGVKIVEYFSGHEPDLVSVLLSDQSHPEFYRSGMLAGAREFIVFPLTKEELGFALERVVQIARTGKARKGAPSEAADSDRKGRVAVLAGGKGGTGVSFICAALAVLTAELKPGLKIAAVDFHPFSGDLATILNIMPAKTLKDIEPAVAELEPQLLMSVAQKIAQNLDLYASPGIIENIGLFAPDQTRLLIDCLRRSYDLILVDNGSHNREENKVFFEVSDLILLNVTADVLSIRATKRFFIYLEKLGISRNNMMLVLNRWEPLFLSADRISEHIGLQAAAQIPESRDADRFLEEGQLPTLNGESELGEPVNRLAQAVCAKLSLMEQVSVG